MGGKGNRIPRARAEQILGGVVKELLPYTKRLTVCGSYRRGTDDCGDGDIVALIPNLGHWVEAMEALGVDPMTQGGSVRKSVSVVRDDFQIDIFRAADGEFGAMLLFATGSGVFNQATRALAKRKGWLLNRYGLWNRSTGALVSSDEGGILEVLGLGWVAPVDRTGWSAAQPKRCKERAYLEAEAERAARPTRRSAAQDIKDLFG